MPRRLVVSVAAVLLLGVAVGLTASADAHPLGLLTLLLGVLAFGSEILAVRFGSRLMVAGWDWCYLLTLFFVGSTAALVVATGAFLAGWLLERYRLVALLVNLAAVLFPIAVGGALFTLADDGGLAFGWAVGAATLTVLTLHVVLAITLVAMLNGVPMDTMVRRVRSIAGPLALQAMFAVAIAGVYRRYGTEAVAVAAVFAVAFAYMVRLVVVAREGATAHAELSWGVLSGLIRTLEMRDPRAARHCAAVARFSRDIARQVGLSKHDQQLAHTAGLLHDIGKFALSDRVLNGEGLDENDWRGIRRHPEIGAELLRDISLYGPVGEIVGAHHERWDGRGYPERLAGEAIPEIARIVAVAEVYDTLTAPDTYRTPTTSFEALTILREAAGRQFDPRFVEALALVLAGQDITYRHAGDADFDVELDMERRISEAARL